MIRIPIILLSLLIFISYGCKKKAGLFAPEFVCKVDGEKLKPSKNGDFKLDPLDASLNDTSFYIVALNGIQSIAFHIYDPSGIKVANYPIPEINSPFNWASYGNFTDRYSTDTIHTGVVKIISIDYEKEVISGRFEYVAKHKHSNETIEITNGKFNIGFKR